MDTDRRLRTEYSLPGRLKRTVNIFDASGNEVEMKTLVTEIQEAVKKNIPEISLDVFPDELVFSMNTARHLLGNGDEQIFSDGLAIFFGMVLAAFMDGHKYRIETETSPIDLDDLEMIEDRFTECVMKRATRATAEVYAYRQNLQAQLSTLENAIQGSVDENTSTGEDFIRDRSSNDHDEECSEDIPELLLGSDDSTS